MFVSDRGGWSPKNTPLGDMQKLLTNVWKKNWQPIRLLNFIQFVGDRNGFETLDSK